jgi:recombination protein U
MASWKSRGLRGSLLEEMINFTNSKYREKKLALIQKVPTPITPIDIDKDSRHITLAYFEQKSTVDYIGVVQGIPVCFDAKECAVDTFNMNNVHEHQIQFMKEFEEQKGIAFLLIYFKKRDIYYYLTFQRLLEFWERAANGGRKSFRFDELDLSYQIPVQQGVCVHYLELIKLDLERREEENT